MAINKRKVKMQFNRYALNTADAAVYIGVSEALLRKMRADGSGPKYSLVSSKIVYPIPELKMFLEQNLVDWSRK